jgi:NAD(P)-dependent dehydrogenase (short-subunit alcohol dehydrogenase family)
MADVGQFPTYAERHIFDLHDKKAMVTGAATGLGAAISVALARVGADVAVCDKPGVSAAQTAAAVEKAGRRALKLDMDVRDLAQIRKGVTRVEKDFGRIDILVNNAGISRTAMGLDVTEELWDDHFNTNVKGGFFVAQAAAKGMIQRGWGRVIFISSQYGFIGIPGQPAYCSSKGAVVQLVRTLGLEWAKCGVTVNSVAPTFIDTDLMHRRLQKPEFLKYVLDRMPIGKLALPEHVSAAVIYLASEEAAMVNCENLRVDGGWTVG